METFIGDFLEENNPPWVTDVDESSSVDCVITTGHSPTVHYTRQETKQKCKHKKHAPWILV